MAARKGIMSDKMLLMNHTELRRPPINIAHSLHTISLDKTVYHGVKPLRGGSHIKSTGTGRYDINNLNLITALDYRGALDAYNKEVQAKKQHQPIANKKIPNVSDRIERTLRDMSNGSDETFEALIDLLQLKTGLSKQKFHHNDEAILEALNKHYRKSPEQLMIVENAYKNA
jgi:hypothetical protein